ncbi:MAG: LytTR family DNA-binding domain-containing protein [Bacteroidota bacterium]
MIERSAKLLKQAYPIPSEGKIPWKNAVGFGLFVGVFLSALRPFGLDDISVGNKTFFIWGYGAITAALMILNVVLARGGFPNLYQEQNWSVGKEIGWMLWNILTIGLANWIYTTYWVNYSWNAETLIYFLLVTLGVGLFPIVLLVLLNANRLLKKHLDEAQALQSLRPNTAPKPHTASLQLKGENQKDEITLQADDLLFIRSADNYVEVQYRSESGIQKRLLRSSLSRIEQYLTKHEQLMRCHRAYIVNLLAVEHFKGDSQGYKLFIRDLAEEIPVSRRYTKAFREMYQNLNQ